MRASLLAVAKSIYYSLIIVSQIRQIYTSEIKMTKNYVFKHYPPPPLPHSFVPGTFALNSRTFNPSLKKPWIRPC